MSLNLVSNHLNVALELHVLALTMMLQLLKAYAYVMRRMHVHGLSMVSILYILLSSLDILLCSCLTDTDIGTHVVLDTGVQIGYMTAG